MIDFLGTSDLQREIYNYWFIFLALWFEFKLIQKFFTGNVNERSARGEYKNRLGCVEREVDCIWFKCMLPATMYVGDTAYPQWVSVQGVHILHVGMRILWKHCILKWTGYFQPHLLQALWPLLLDWLSNTPLWPCLCIVCLPPIGFKLRSSPNCLV